MKADEGWELVGFDDYACLFKRKKSERPVISLPLQGEKSDEWEVLCQKDVYFEGEQKPAYEEGEWYDTYYTGKALVATGNELGAYDHVLLGKGREAFFSDHFKLYRNGSRYSLFARKGGGV